MNKMNSWTGYFGLWATYDNRQMIWGESWKSRQS
jgi:hypothetical protein